MAKYQTIEAAVRSEFGKGSARRARVAGQIPAVVYGADVESNLHVTIDHRTFAALVRQEGVNAVLELDIEGQKQLTMIKHIDQNVLTFNIDHLDLLAIKRGEKVEVDVPVIVEGEPAPGTMWVQDADTIKVEADVLSIPEEFTVSIEGLELGAQITAADIKLEGDTTLVEDPETLIVNIVLPAVEEEETEDDEAAAEGEEAATE
ncbi:50S ribosomal protein L25/general stress protein Ctc [Corynebacterium glutamicum]|uniref:50S ribosomal protein L25/general stress protein Ctc n=1 Tax=Corynebacterium TaxID=1716 RepID=UPI0007206700|nr:MULTISPECIES: 50S ribosomal protein L25/general stress protein Ctc [Corynebacterium]ALP49680.1 50S ribosomal protein L25 [Corynebacterium glutamicum]ANR62013.1 50S ribosomal protein L25/general stress protein Ctc [[Brevibacterium] flavum ZL-1]ANR65013.1 50S ribosomal protein L25/general stress protein Ctc [Corynebacterium glutamicum ZL-6]ANU33192.1 50S ribosomal protein L25/general stress protein Ctc [Corynebacterium glutamicum]APT06942.1 50S ribosomal protein L25/general stress protein Ctc